MTGERRSNIGESERWLSVIAGGMLALSSLRRRDLGTGVLFATGAAALIYRGLTGHDGLGEAIRGTLAGATARPAGSPTSRVDGAAGVGSAAPSEGSDAVEEASMESFPASDPPSWTPTSGS